MAAVGLSSAMLELLLNYVDLSSKDNRCRICNMNKSGRNKRDKLKP